MIKFNKLFRSATMATNNNEWHNEWQRVTTNDNEWYIEWRRVTSRGRTSDNEWYSKYRVVKQIHQIPLNYLSNTLYIRNLWLQVLFFKKNLSIAKWIMDGRRYFCEIRKHCTLKKNCSLRLNAVTYKENAQFVQNTTFGVWEKKW